MNMQWHVNEVFETSTDTVAGGCCGDGPDLVLAHGWPWSSYSWHRVIPSLAECHRVYWYDMPRYGQSAKPADQAMSLDVQGEVFADLLDRWDCRSRA